MAAKACLAVTAVMAATVHPELRERKARAGDRVRSHFVAVHGCILVSTATALVDPLGVKGPARGRYSASIPVGWSGARWAAGGGGESAPGNQKLSTSDLLPAGGNSQGGWET